MKNVPSIKTNNTESPKTPGGISKTLLTPCRRVGLSRNWKRSGSSPFISPLSNGGEASQDRTEVRKRKETSADVEKATEECEKVTENCSNVCVDKTPSRNTDLPRRKKSKILLSALNPDEEITTSPIGVIEIKDSNSVSVSGTEVTESLATPVRLKSRSKSKKSLSSVLSSKNDINSHNCTNIAENSDIDVEVSNNVNVTTKENSPKDLIKECIVIIRKKILKQKSNEFENIKIEKEDEKVNEKIQNVEKSSQGLFDSDSDDVPLCKINQKEAKVLSPSKSDDDDFVENNVVIPKIVKANKKDNKEQTLVKKPKDSKSKNIKNLKTKEINVEPTRADVLEDDDFEFENKRTILIRKSYEKVSRPLKAKSTGSITQKDIDNIRARIESKKKLLLAKAMTEDTEELRELIKKWRVGCQNALMELMELMKTKCSDKQNMDYSDILKSLKIPSSLVGYDSDNECFNTPDDASIILSGLNL